MKKKILQIGICASLQVLGAIVLGFLLLVLVYTLPLTPIRQNVANALPMIEAEGDYPTWGMVTSTKLDGFTDHLMLNEASAESGYGSVILDALRNPHMVTEEEGSQAQNLEASLQDSGEGKVRAKDYARYWHGYLVILKPLLSVLSVPEIRMLHAGAVLFLFTAATLVLGFRIGKRGAVSLFLAFLSLAPVTLMLCMTYGVIWQISMVAILLLVREERYFMEGKKYLFLFLWCGIAVAYFDYLTYPAAALGMPLAVLVVLGNGGIRNQLKKMAGAAAFFLFGYASMWAGKWILAQLLTGDSVIADAKNTVVDRAGSSNEVDSSLHSILARSFGEMGNRAFLLAVLLFLLALVVLLLTKKMQVRLEGAKVIPLLLTACLPFLWYFGVRDHSAEHISNAFRELCVFVFSLSLCLQEKSTSRRPVKMSDAEGLH